MGAAIAIIIIIIIIMCIVVQYSKNLSDKYHFHMQYLDDTLF